MKQTNQSGFSAVEAILIIVVVAMLGFTGWFVWHSQKAADKTLSDANKSTTAQTTNKVVVTNFAECKAATGSKVQETSPEQCVTKDGKKFTDVPQASTQSYLIVKEWGLRFKIPAGLTDVQYKIFSKTSSNDDQLAIYAKPTGYDVKYISDYQSSSEGIPNHSVGILYRSSDATKDRTDDNVVKGKKIGNYYYYTAWAFNGLATGAGCTGLYGDDEQSCVTQSVAFKLVNQGDTALLDSVESVQ